ncbi:hypothetical protein Vretimale_12431, partial [Volvox reticuliferus]
MASSSEHITSPYSLASQLAVQVGRHLSAVIQTTGQEQHTIGAIPLVEVDRATLAAQPALGRLARRLDHLGRAGALLGRGRSGGLLEQSLDLHLDWLLLEVDKKRRAAQVISAIDASAIK